MTEGRPPAALAVGASFAMTALAAFVLLGASGVEAEESGLRERGPIIDMHLHAFGWDEFGDPPPPDDVAGERGSCSARTR